MNLSKNQITYLKSLGNSINNKYQLGKNEINENVIKLLDNALKKHELIKVNVHQTVAEHKLEFAKALEKALDCYIVQIIGNVILIYRKNLESPMIILPKYE